MEILFNSKTPGWEWLSNFWLCPIESLKMNLTFPSAEHAYQACRSTNPIDWSFVQNLPFAWQAKAWAKNIVGSPDERSNWHTEKVRYMARIVHCKFFQNHDLGDKLLATYPHNLVHLSPWDTFWGVDKAGQGQNELGKILMKVRSDLGYFRTEQACEW